jgi:hypothetical protein
MAQIELTHGYKTIVDDDDYDWLSRLRWVARVLEGSKVYARHQTTKNKKPFRCYMHRLITEAPRELIVDHRNGDTLDNRRINLRLTTKSRNSLNITKQRSDNKSGFRGVSWSKSVGRWQAVATIEGIQKGLGYFDTPEAAHLAYRVYLESQLGQNYEAEICPAFFNE